MYTASDTADQQTEAEESAQGHLQWCCRRCVGVGEASCKNKASNPTIPAQKLGIASLAHSPDPRAMDRYMATVAAPLLASKQEALQALFSDGFDPVGMALDFSGFELNAP